MQMFSEILLIVLLSLTACNNKNHETHESAAVRQLWLSCGLKDTIPFGVFDTAMTGYNKWKNDIRNKGVMTIIDFSRPSTEKRFFVIDLEKKKLLYSCLVAHGKNSGDKYAESFSNENESLKSSMGFFLTAETYTGKHGYSLRLDGLEKGINDNARSREIVVHGAEYVSQKFIDEHGMLGRSWGCPALPVEITKDVIDKICGGSCLYIYSNNP